MDIVQVNGRVSVARRRTVDDARFKGRSAVTNEDRKKESREAEACEVVYSELV